MDERPCKPVPGVLPADLCIRNESVLAMLLRGAWDLIVEEDDDYYDRMFNITAIPKAIPGVKQACLEKSPTRGMYVDTNIAECNVETEEGYSQCKCRLKPDSGYSRDLQAKEEPGKLFRGVSWEEMEFINKNGFIQSNCSYNIGECQIGLTYFSADPETAATYAGAFQPYPFLPTFERPGYVLKIPRPPDDRLDLVSAPPGEIGVRGKIPIDEVEAIYEVRPYAIHPGYVELRASKHFEPTILHEGSRVGPSHWIAYKQTFQKH